MWSESDAFRFLYTAIFTIGAFYAMLCILFGYAKTVQMNKKLEAEARRQATLRHYRLWMPAFDLEYQQLHASLLRHADKLQEKQ
ncbi:MAG TPA: hypothetical protein VII61_09795 [Ktedonobacteraceae bacterium]